MAIGKIYTEIYANKITATETGGSQITRELLPTQKNLRFDRNTIQELDTCNFQFYADQPSDLSILDVVEILVYNQDTSGNRTLVDSYNYQVIGIDIESVDQKKTIWNHLVSGTECTKRLEGYYITRDFSQPLPNELATPDGELPTNAQVVDYEGYPNRLKMVDEAKRFCYFRKEADISLINMRPWDYIQGDPNLDPNYMNGEDNTGTTYALLSEDLGTDNIARVAASNDNLRDVLDEIFSAYGSTTRVNFVNGQFVLLADNQNAVVDEINITRHAKTKISKTINGYGTFVNPDLQNVVGQESIAINGQNGRPFVSETVFTQTDTAKIVVDYPIKDIIEVRVANLDSNTWYDITKYIIKDEQRKFLPKKETPIVSGDDIYINNVGSYKEGGYEINGFGDEFDGEVLPFIGAAIDDCWNMVRISSGATGLNTDIRQCRARVQYRTLTTEKVQIFKNDFTDQKHLFASPINENSQTLDFKKAGISLQDKVEKTGTPTTEIDIVLNDELIQKGDNYYDIKQVDLETGLVIVKVDNTIINGNIKTKYTLAKGGYLNAQVVVDSLKRASAIEYGLVRELIVKDFVNIGYGFAVLPESQNVDSSLTDEGMKKFMDTFRTNNTIDANVDGAILVSNELLNVVAVGVSKHLTKDYAKVGFKANNPVHLGYKQNINNERQAVRYAVRNGTTQEIGLSYGLSEAITNNQEYNRSLPEINFLGSISEPIVGTKLIDMGDTSATDGGFGEENRDTDSESESRSFAIPIGQITTGGVSIDTELSFTKRDGFTLIPTTLSLEVGYTTSNYQGSTPQVSASYTYAVYIDGGVNPVESETVSSDKIINLTQYTRVNSVRVTLNGSLSVSFDNRRGGRNGNANLTISGLLEVYEEEILPPVEGERDTTLKVLKTPNEILGVSHSLNVIKDPVIITGQNFMGKNSLYTNHNYDSFVVYRSESEYYVDGDEIPKGVVDPSSGFSVGHSNSVGSISMSTQLLDTSTGNRVSLKSMAIFGVVNGKLELLIAINAPYGGSLSFDEIFGFGTLSIGLQFSSKAKGLIME